MNTYHPDDVVKAAIKACLQPNQSVALIGPSMTVKNLLQDTLKRHIDAVPAWLLSNIVSLTRAAVQFDNSSAIRLFGSINTIRGYSFTHVALYYSRGLAWPWSDEEVLCTVAPAIKGRLSERLIYMSYV